MHRLSIWLGASVIAGALLSARPAAADTPDAWITAKTKLALLTSEGVSATDVNVDTLDGKVTLHGKVKSEAEKAKADEVAHKIDGVKDVRNLLQVVPKSSEKMVERSDETIKDEVERMFKADPVLDASGIKVASVNKGVVLLSGKTDSMSAQVDAVTMARSVPGVTRVASEITGPDKLADSEIWREDVKDAGHAAKDAGRSAERKMKDAWITSAVKTVLIADGDVPALDVNVDTRRGVVTLFGIVPSEEAKAKAEKDAHKVDGVKSVQNGLEVVPKAHKEAVKEADEAIEKRAEKEIAAQPGGDDVHVEVKNGVARLTGKVLSRSDSMRLSIVARGVSGVRSVQNDLRVGDEMAASTTGGARKY